MEEVKELYEQVAQDKPRIDRDKGIIYRVHILGRKSANGYDYALDGIKSAYSKYEQMPVSINHDYNSTPLKVENTWGTFNNPECDDDGAWAELHYLKSHPLTEQILEDAERGTGLFSLSSVNGCVVQKGKTVVSFSPIRCDLVVKGATTKTLLEQEEVKVENTEIKVEEKVEIKTVSYEQYQSLEDKVNQQADEISNLKKQLELHKEYITPKTALEQKIEQTVKGIDLKQFWNDKEVK